MSFNFGKTEAAKGISFLKPGVYAMQITEVKLDKFPGGSTYLGITFTNEEGLTLTEKMGYNVKDEKAKQNEIFLSRLQYLHEGWSGKKCEKDFKSVKEIEAYFAKMFVNPKAGTRNVVIGGEVTAAGKTYASLPFTSFILDKDSELELGEFEEGDDNWKKYVKKSNRKSETAGQKNGILNEETAEVSANGKAEDDDDTPWS